MPIRPPRFNERGETITIASGKPQDLDLLCINTIRTLAMDAVLKADSGDVIGLSTFGASAPCKENFQHYGFTVENVVEHARKLVAR